MESLQIEKFEGARKTKGPSQYGPKSPMPAYSRCTVDLSDIAHWFSNGNVVSTLHIL